MTNDYKKRIESIMLKHAAKQLKQNKKPKRKNQRPEKDTERECLDWMRSEGWDIAIYESKASWNKSAQRYMANSGVKAGTCDCIGTMPDGVGVFIEFKAKGKLNSFSRLSNGAQQEFLKSKIKMNAFACVVDSAEMLWCIHKRWTALRANSLDLAREYLSSLVPEKNSPLDFGI